jgi:adenylosuccinate synthase
VAARYVARLNGVTEIALTLLDVLDSFEEINVCTEYRLNEVSIDYLPAREDLLAQVSPVLTAVPGWTTDTTSARSIDELPDGARGYISFLEEQIGARVTMVGVGPDREQLVPLTDDAAILAVA